MAKRSKLAVQNRPTKRRNPRRKPGSKKSETRINLYGLHTVRAAIENPKRRIYNIKCTKNALQRLRPALEKRSFDHAQGPTTDAEKHAEDEERTKTKGGRTDLNVETVEAKALDALVSPDAVHQGVVAICDPLPTLDASELLHLADARLLLILDQITDPHNVGAILRSAVAMGVEAVLMTHRKSAPETAVLAKAASGALDMIDIVDVRNLSKAIGELNDMGFATIGLDSEGPNVLEAELDRAKGRPLALVLGSEGRGLREQTREACAALARLDMPGAIKSLNVSNAAALSLYLASKTINR